MPTPARSRFVFAILIGALGVEMSAGALLAQESATAAPPAESALNGIAAATVHDPAAVRALIDRARRSVVVITFAGRDGQQQGLGSGFVVGEEGLIATNLHVLGEARPISVQLLDGRTFDVVEIHATEKSHDLAIVRIEAESLPALPLGSVEDLKEGDPLVAIGNPQGLKHSVVTGVAGVRKDVDGMDMLQLAMPIERGNSGGPVLTLDGRVVGLVTLKSLAEENIAFAVAADHLRPLLEKPNPIPMKRWLTIGVINARLWEAPQDGVRWTQRAGRIRVTGSGQGFGGRSLCYARTDVPEPPYEVAVSVLVQQEDGAAGLLFLGDGGERHYGFYPSSGSLRLTRFDGPTVYQWDVLREERSPSFRPGEWNRLKVRVEPDRLRCYCNDALVFEVVPSDQFPLRGRVGLAKFRHTTAEFKEFRVGVNLPSALPDPALAAAVTQRVLDIPTARPPSPELVSELVEQGPGARQVLEERARLLERQAERLRQLSAEMHAAGVRRELAAIFQKPVEELDLLHAALLIARLDNPDLDVDAYRQEIDAMAAEFLAALPAEVDETDRLAAFHRFLFEEHGFHGSRVQYYTAANSYLNEVIDDREGLPITLSILYIELGRRCGLDVVGIGLPGHFVVQYRPQAGEPVLVDPFERGRTLTHAEAARIVQSITGLEWNDRFLEPQHPRQIILRMLRNLLNVANADGNPEAALRYIDTLLALDPESPTDRLFKAVLCLNTNRIEEGLQETDWVLERQPEEIAIDQVYRLRAALEALRTP